MKLNEYFTKNKQNVLKVTGFYNSKEINNSNFQNLGIARANSINKYLITLGINQENISISGKLNDSLVPNNDGIYCGASFFKIINNNNKGLKHEKIENNIKLAPEIFYFKIGKYSIDLTQKERQKLSNIIKYLKKYKDKKCKIVGYTDNIGNAKFNINLFLKRAEFAKNYLIEKGVLSKKILVFYKGEKKPLSDNKTSDGRSKNRRIEITIQ